MLLIYWYRKNTGMVFVYLYLKGIIIHEALFENEMYWWKRIYYYNINISPFGGLWGKISCCIVLCTLSQNNFDMWKRVWVRLSFKCFNVFTLCKNKCTNWMGWCFDFLSFWDWANKAVKLKMKYTKAADMDGRNWVVL